MYRELSLRETQGIVLGILIDVAKFCEENDIKYMLYYGTLLGAIRHKGFIPWDDDIDIAMTRTNYEKFLVLYRNSSHNKNYVLKIPSDKNYFLPWTKVEDIRTCSCYKNGHKLEFGITIDVFPIDSQYDNEKLARKVLAKQRFLYFSIIDKLNIRADEKRLKTTLKKCLQNTGMATIATRCSVNAPQVRLSHKPKYAGCNVFPCYGVFERQNVEVYENLILSKFEDEKFYIPENYDAILRQIYGDYMKLPPIEQRQSLHKTTNYLIEP